MPAKQRTTTLSDGKTIPLVAWGNGTSGLQKSGDKAVATGKLALDAGITHLDTAQYYETEAETTAAVKAAGVDRATVFITDKVSDNTVAAKATTPENIRQSVDESLKKLGTLPDLLLIHNPFVPEQGKIGEFWTILEDLVYDGTLKGVSLGVSNFRPQDLKAVLDVARIKPVANQIEFHPYLLAQLEPLLALHAEHGIVTESYGPLTPLLRHPTGGPLKPVLEEIGARLGLDAATVLLLWTVQRGVVAVTTSNSAGNIKKIASLNELPDLSAEDVKAIEDAGKKVHFRHYTEHMTKDFAAPDLPAE